MYRANEILQHGAVRAACFLVDVELPPEDLFIRQVGNVSALGFNGTSNTRDNDISPAGGGLSAVSFELGVANTTTVTSAPESFKQRRMLVFTP